MTSEQLTRSASLQWLTNPPEGNGRLKVGSGALVAIKVSLAQEEPTPGETTPGELFAATLAGYFALHLALQMQLAERPLSELVIDAALSISPWPEYVIQRVELSVRGRLCEAGAADEVEFSSAIDKTLDAVAKSLHMQDGLMRIAESGLQ